MAKTAAKRDFANVDAVTGLGTLTVKIDDKVSTTVKGIPDGVKAFQNLVASTKDADGDGPKPLTSIYTIYLRGIESSARATYKQKHNTMVVLGGGKKIDLMAFAEKKGLAMAVKHINNRFDTLADLNTMEDDSKKTSEQIAGEKAALRKREAGWYNAADALVSSGKCKLDNGRLVVAA